MAAKKKAGTSSGGSRAANLSAAKSMFSGWSGSKPGKSGGLKSGSVKAKKR